jgi:TPR repeat protein
MFNIGVIYRDGVSVTHSYVQAKRWFERAPAAAFAPAMIRLGDLCRDGRGVAKNVNDARAGYQKAAAADSPESQSRLAALPCK